MDDYQRFWLSTVKHVDEFLLRRVRKGQRFRLATSAGGRPVWAVQYGLPAREKAHTNFSAALGAGEFDTFWGAHDLEHPIVVIVCGTHGAEMEGVVGAINLLSILETGHDLRDRPWPKIVSLAEQMRIIIVPLHNPDGRARVEPESLIGLSYEEFRYWAQGRWQTGELIGYPACKRYQPLPLDAVEFLGGYPNDTGYNIMHDVAVTGPKTTEAQALLALVERERPDVVLHVHSCPLGPFIIGPSHIVPDSYVDVHYSIQQRMYDAWLKRGLRPEKPSRRRRFTFNLTTACFLAGGAVSLTMEGPHGIATRPYSYDEILDVHLSLYEELFDCILHLPVRARNLLEGC